MAKSGNPFLTCCWLTLLILVISLIVSIVFLYFGQDELIYQNDFPSPYEEYPEENQEGKRNPGEKNMLYEDITIETEDDVRLAGWLIHHGATTKAHPTLIYMHQSSGNIGHRLAWAENIYFNLGYNIVLVGYRGYGHSEGSPSEKGLQKDSKAMIQWTLANPKINPNQVFLFGSQLGGAVATYGAEFFENKLKGLILENTFYNFKAAVDDTNWLFRLLRPIILANYWPTNEVIARLNIPMLFISGLDSDTNDDMQQLRDLATNSALVEFLNVPKAGKQNTWRVGGRSYLMAIDEFVVKANGIIKLPVEAQPLVDSI
ncbi:unnamed protein product [Moneuplotes crassus]|uniref:Serine aminopeptidase S33 domain-containing protein n=2 Tax=Euplotes crassus TaxID=5936 RepID=A0AAD2CZV5_EUPCR|nr:unnamed protein product [Moneuplotes crassus]